MTAFVMKEPLLTSRLACVDVCSVGVTQRAVRLADRSHCDADHHGMSMDATLCSQTAARAAPALEADTRWTYI